MERNTINFDAGGLVCLSLNFTVKQVGLWTRLRKGF